MKNFLLKLFGYKQKPLSIKEAQQIEFEYVARKEVPKTLGLVHNPKVKTVMPDKELSFNQKASALHRQLKKGLPKVKTAMA